MQPGDNKLTCPQIEVEFERLEDAGAAVDENRGLTGTNVVSALFWIPGLAYTYYDAGQADELISERRSHLTDLYNRKGC
jgi:hypothetical protein